jgi:Glycosyl hydrolases family 28
MPDTTGRDRRRLLTSAASAYGLTALISPFLAAGAPAPESSSPQVYNVHDYHARGDGKTLDTAAIQAAIDACTRGGGGVVLFPAGRFLSGTITLKDNVTLHLSAAATLLGSQNPKDYVAKPFPARDLDVGGFEVWALIYADGAANIGLEGKGAIDGAGKPFPPTKHTPDIAGSVRPRAIFLKSCKQVKVRDITIRESAMWSAHFALCENVFIHGITIYSDSFYNQDGIILDSCQDSLVSDCFIDTLDDALVIKASYPRPCKNLAITNCVLTSRCAAIKFGTQSLGGFQNVAISNCSCHDCRLGGLKFETVDGGDLENVTVSNISMTNVSAPIFFKLGNRAQDFGFKEVEHPRPIAKLRRVVISGIRATVSGNEKWRSGATIIIAGLPGHPVENVVLNDIHITYPGGGTLPEAARTDIPEREGAYPENTMFGVLPAYGFYLRHAKGITLRDVRLELEKPDLRPALICDDVDDLELTGFRAGTSGGDPLIRLRQTRTVLIQNSRAIGNVETFLRVEGENSEGIALLGNDLRGVRTIVDRGDGFTGEIPEAGNLTAKA